MTDNIYTPPNCHPLSSDKSIPQIRLGIQGYGGTGKTFASLTFPNPIVLNLDRGLEAHQGREDVIEIPFYKFEFKGSHPSMLKDRLMSWLNTEAIKLKPSQTLVFDGCTTLQNAYHSWFKANQVNFLTKQGKVDDFAEWREKKNYYNEIMELFKVLSCNVIFICHEAAQKDKDGGYTGKIRPLLTGAFNDELVNHFSNFFRQHSADKPSDYTSIKPESLALWGCKTTQEFKEICDLFPRNTIYYWQTESDNIFDAKCSLLNAPRFIPATYQSFNKYKRNKVV